MSSDLAFGQGTYHRADMLPDSGDEVNALWGDYAMENAEWAYANRLTQLVEDYGSALYDAGRNAFVRLNDCGTVHIHLNMNFGQAGTGTLTMVLNGGTVGVHRQPGGFSLGTTIGLGTRYGDSWGTFFAKTTNGAGDAFGTMYHFGVWGQA